MPNNPISIQGLDDVVQGYNNIDKGLNGPVYKGAADLIEIDIEESGRGWKGSGRVRTAVTTETNKEGVEVRFISTTAKHSLDPLGNLFVKTMQKNTDKYIKEIEDQIGEAFDG